MSTVYLKDYLQKISNIYSKAKDEYFTAADQLAQLTEKWKQERARGWNDSSERNKSETEFLAAERELKKKLNTIREDARERIKELSEETDRVFTNHYRPHASQVDLQAVELLKAGVLSDRELTFLVEDYKDNFAMLRMLQPYIEKASEKNPQLRKAHGELLARTKVFTVHQDAISQLCAWGDKQIQDDVELSKTMAKHFDTKAPQIIEHYGEYSAESIE